MKILLPIILFINEAFCQPEPGACAHVSICFQRLLWDIQSLLSPSGSPRRPKPEYPIKSPQYGNGQNQAIGQNPNPGFHPGVMPQFPNPGFQGQGPRGGFGPSNPQNQVRPPPAFLAPQFIRNQPARASRKGPLLLKWLQMNPSPPKFLIESHYYHSGGLKLEWTQTIPSNYYQVKVPFIKKGNYDIFVAAADQSGQTIIGPWGKFAVLVGPNVLTKPPS